MLVIWEFEIKYYFKCKQFTSNNLKKQNKKKKKKKKKKRASLKGKNLLPVEQILSFKSCHL